MSKRPATKPGLKSPAKKSDKEAEETLELPAPRPLKPRRQLFVILLIVFAIWLAGLLTLYFAKVYPMRHPSSAPASDVK